MTRPIPQSIAGWRAGRTRTKARASGRERATPAALPRADIRTASSPRPSRQRACAGRTASDVSASGMPRKVLGTLSRNVCVTRVENIAEATTTGSNQASRSAWSERRTPAMVFAWMPGTRPLTAPQPMPMMVPSTILKSTLIYGRSRL
jgi:hypothetical protein